MQFLAEGSALLLLGEGLPYEHCSQDSHGCGNARATFQVQNGLNDKQDDCDSCVQRSVEKRVATNH
ncbi:MAG: hypothetical protein CL583_02535 [Alteromonadaceae bacterium]|nr:hypothetical protein [Alteromonadaceae bacterium]